jgi:hypothetical protein
MRQALDHDLAGGREVPHPARVDATQVLGQDRDVLVGQVLAHEFGIARTYRVGGESLEHVGTAKHLGFQPLAVGAALEQVVDQQFHRITAIAGRGAITAVAIGQQEMIHAADAQQRVADAGRHATAQRRGQGGLVIHHQVLGGQQLGGQRAKACIVVTHDLVAGVGGGAHAPALRARWYRVRPHGVIRSAACR